MANLIIKFFLSAIVMTIMSCTLFAQREMKTINDGWDFKKQGEEKWNSVNIPHTFNLDAYSGRHYYQGKALYRKLLYLPKIDKDRNYYLKIDAANKSAEVKVNGKKIGTHLGGYSAFIMDITDLIKEKNEIEIIVDNSRKDITPIWADFTFWGGIYRDIWIISTNKQHFNMENHASSGVFVNTPVVDSQKGMIRVKAEIVNDADAKVKMIIENCIYDCNGNLIQTMTKPLVLKSYESKSLIFYSDLIKSPRLWTPECPNLYRVITSIKNSKTGDVIDELSNKIGFRWFSFDADKGFILNGKPYKLRGLNRHQDQAPVGVAIDDEVNRRDIKLMKDIGCNFIRISHYPQDDAILDACDEIGLLAWEEIPIIDMVPDTPGYDDNCEKNLLDMVRQHYNHTCVIAWGYMNEILLIAPTPDKPEWPAVKERTVKLAQRLEKVLKREDPDRASVMAFHGSDLYNTIGLNLEDVAGWNLYQGWYFGELNDFEKWLEDQHERYPKHPIIVSEWGAGSDRRIHSEKSKAFDFSIEYQQKYIEHYLPYIEHSDYIAGCAYWCFVDFNVAARQESMPRVNNKGIFYNDRTMKDVAYYFKSMWRNDIPVLHIASRDWDIRTGKETDKNQFKIYTNVDEVELFLNDISYGKKKVENYNAIYSICLPFGESWLKAKGYRDGKLVEDMMKITYNKIPDLSKGEELAINVGSNCYFTSDISNLTWIPDQQYINGEWGYVGGNERNTTSEIFNTIDVPIYQTYVEDIKEYRIDAPKGVYEVELLMTDVSRPSQQQANLLGRGDKKNSIVSNRFDIVICGKRVEQDFSPADYAYYLNASRRRYIVNNSNGCIDIHFIKKQGRTFLSGVKIRKL